MLIRLLFFEKTTLSTSRRQNFVFPSFFLRVRASSEVQTQTNCLRVSHFAASNQ